MIESADAAPTPPGGTFAPLRERTFRTIWTASLLSNFGQLILGVGAAWEMTRLTSSASMVALVQTALMLPLMLVAVPAGAIADMFDRRKIAMAGLGASMIFAGVLTTLAFFELTSPWVILVFCSLIGGGVALYSPAWQASISEQVEPAHLPAAVALGTISSSVARSIGPGHRRADRTCRRGQGGVCNQCRFLPALVHRLLLLEASTRPSAPAARTPQSRHRVGRALYSPFRPDPDGAVPLVYLRSGGRNRDGLGPPDRARPAAR